MLQLSEEMMANIQKNSQEESFNKNKVAKSEKQKIREATIKERAKMVEALPWEEAKDNLLEYLNWFETNNLQSKYNSLLTYAFNWVEDHQEVNPDIERRDVLAKNIRNYKTNLERDPGDEFLIQHIAKLEAELKLLSDKYGEYESPNNKKKEETSEEQESN